SFLSVRAFFHVWHPRGPLKTEVWTMYFVDKAAPREVKDALRKGVTLSFGPSGTMEQDDVNNFEQCSASGKGLVGKRYPMNLRQGIYHERSHEILPGKVSQAVGENCQRALYKR